MFKIPAIDSHTEGEPTRVLWESAPPLGAGTMAERLAVFSSKFDDFRRAVTNEPRGSEALVGALLCEPVDVEATAGVIFFNNVGFLGMCGHGTIGLIATLKYMGRIGPGAHRIETPVGNVTATLAEDGSVSIQNVHSYRYRADVEVDVPGFGVVRGDIAYGGNWFFLVEASHVPIQSANMDALTDYTKRIKTALVANGITGKDGAEIDHIELFGPPERADADSKNYVLCPGNAYDRSPCGTGLSAKLSCLAARGKLEEGVEWRQESIIGTLFRGRYVKDGEGIVPTITGNAYVTAEVSLVFDPDDPLKGGIRL